MNNSYPYYYIYSITHIGNNSIYKINKKLNLKFGIELTTDQKKRFLNIKENLEYFNGAVYEDQFNIWTK